MLVLKNCKNNTFITMVAKPRADLNLTLQFRAANSTLATDVLPL
jgi:hypothetical protein